MALKGIGTEYDISLKPSSTLKTSTTQYLAVGMQGATTTADFTAYLADAGSALDDTMTARYAIGINQSYMSSGSEACNVRMFGLSKAKCAASIAAGDFVACYEGISTTTRAGQIVSIANGLTLTVASLTSQKVILGRALEDGSTGTTINIFVNTQLYDTTLL